MDAPWKDEPRWPAGTPGGGHVPGPGPGRWREGEAAGVPGGWLTKAASRVRGRRFTRGLMTREQITSYAHREDYQVEGTAFGGTGEVTFRRYSDGTELAFKTFYANEEHEFDAEVEASIVGHALGAPVPAVVRAPSHDWRGGEGLLMQRLEEVEPYTSMSRTERWNAIDREKDSDRGRMLGLFDLVIGNHDRHPGNVMMTADGLVGFDHGMAFRTHRHGGHVLGYWGGRAEMTGLEMSASRFGLPLLVKNERNRPVAQGTFSREAIQEARRRLQSVQDQISPTHWQGMMATLDVLEQHSTGTHWLD